MEVRIMRGLPGSGKSHWAGNLLEQYILKKKGARILSADTYFCTKDGAYEFKPEKVVEAHHSVFLDYLSTINRRYDSFPVELVIVDNTNTTLWELSPYYRVAEVLGADVEVVQMDAPLEVCLARQTHGVPVEKMFGMYHNLKVNKLPHHYKVRFMDGTYAGDRGV